MSSRHLRRLKQHHHSTNILSSDDDDDEQGNLFSSQDDHHDNDHRQRNLFSLLSEDLHCEQASDHDGDDGGGDNEPVITPESKDKKRDSKVSSTSTNNNRPSTTNKMVERKKKEKDEEENGENEYENDDGEAWPLLCKPKWHTVDLDGLEEPRMVRERMSTVSGQMKRPFGRLVAPRKSWPKVSASSLGFQVQKVQASVNPENMEYALVSSKEYNEKFHDLQLLISSADVAALSLFVKENAHIVEGYLLMSDVVRQHSVADAASLTELAIYLIEKGLPTKFSWSSCQMCYDKHPENRSIHLALFRHVQFLVRRASWKTALETAKILYNLDRSDPLMVMLLIDYILLHTKDLTTHDSLYADLKEHPKYPFLQYTRYLLYSNHQQFAPLLEAEQVFDKVDCNETFTHAVFKLYFGRTSSLWKTVKIPSNLPTNKHDISEMKFDDKLAIYRHGLLTDLPGIHLAYPSSSTLTLDPFPPTVDGTEYPGYSRRGRLSSTLSSMFNRLSLALA